MTTNQTAAIESLRTFALSHNELAFANLCTAALEGEAWAIERVRDSSESIACEEMDLVATGRRKRDAAARVTLRTIRTTDTTRPDGAIARGLVSP